MREFLPDETSSLSSSSDVISSILVGPSATRCDDITEMFCTSSSCTNEMAVRFTFWWAVPNESSFGMLIVDDADDDDEEESDRFFFWVGSGEPNGGPSSIGIRLLFAVVEFVVVVVDHEAEVRNVSLGRFDGGCCCCLNDTNVTEEDDRRSEAACLATSNKT